MTHMVRNFCKLMPKSLTLFVFEIDPVLLFILSAGRCTSRRVRDLWWQGIPPSVRGKVWSLAVGNDLNITHGTLAQMCDSVWLDTVLDMMLVLTGHRRIEWVDRTKVCSPEMLLKKHYWYFKMNVYILLKKITNIMITGPLYNTKIFACWKILLRDPVYNDLVFV